MKKFFFLTVLEEEDECSLLGWLCKGKCPSYSKINTEYIFTTSNWLIISCLVSCYLDIEIVSCMINFIAEDNYVYAPFVYLICKSQGKYFMILISFSTSGIFCRLLITSANYFGQTF